MIYSFFVKPTVDDKFKKVQVDGKHKRKQDGAAVG
jgi:hypothetical protein